MTNATMAQEIVRQLDQLPLELQRRVLEFAEALVLSQPKGTPGVQVLRFAGTITPDDAQAMLEAIEIGCEQVDLDAW